MKANQKRTVIVLIVCIVGLIVASAFAFFAIRSNSKDNEAYVAYEIDRINSCFWEGGKARYGSKVRVNLEKVSVKKSDEKAYLEKAESQRSCVFPETTK